ncbi:hypothetical protein [Mesorhizobium sp. 113-1-2]|nr:hypothetical protein [Mesorhizobium sp. 113-1-2]
MALPPLGLGPPGTALEVSIHGERRPARVIADRRLSLMRQPFAAESDAL